MSALDEMGDFLSGSDSARDVEDVAKSLGSAIGNVVGASIDSYQKAANGTSAGDPVSSARLARIFFFKNIAYKNTESRCKFNDITLNFPIMRGALVVLMFLATVFSKV